MKAKKVSAGKRALTSMPKGHADIVSSLPSRIGKVEAMTAAPEKATNKLPRRSRSNTSARKVSPAIPKKGKVRSPSAQKSKTVGSSGQDNCAQKSPYIAAAASDSQTGGKVGLNFGADGQNRIADLSDLPTIIALLQELAEQRRDLLGTKVGLTNRLKALVKSKRGLSLDADVSEADIRETDYPPLLILSQAREHIQTRIKGLEKALTEQSVKLPGYQALWQPTCGLGALGLALIIGEAGDLSNYSTHSKLWCRMGLHVFEGRALYTKRSGMTGEQWEAAGYCPRRRSLVYQIVDSLMKKENAYRELRDKRREIEREKARVEGLKVAPAAKIPKARKDEFRSEGHILNRANRYVGKKLLRDLWKIWRREATKESPDGHPLDSSRSPSSSAREVITAISADHLTLASRAEVNV